MVIRNLKNKRVLITAGPTWVPIDKVRVISNIATGETGILLAEKLQREGAKVTLLLGPIEPCCLSNKIRLIRFKFLDEFKKIIIKELKSKKYDMVVHSAAVSDYKPLKIYSQKIKSGIKNWRLNLVPTEKVIDLIKKIDKNIFLVGFKFEWNTKKSLLIKMAQNLMRRFKTDLVVANTIYNNRYIAYILNKHHISRPIFSKEGLAENLINIISHQVPK